MGLKRVGAAILIAITLTLNLEIIVSLKTVGTLVNKSVQKPVIKHNASINEKPVNQPAIKPVVSIVKSKVENPVEKLNKSEVKKPVKQPVKTYYKKTTEGLEISKDDYELLVRIAQSEAGDESMDSQIGVVNVVLNRVHSPKFPNTIRAVVYQKHQFSVVANGSINKPVESMNYEAVDRAISGENTVGNCLFFWADYVDNSNYLWSKTVQYKYDRTVFAN